MNRGDLVLSAIRAALTAETDFTVLNVWEEREAETDVEAYPFIIKDNLSDEVLESGVMADVRHDVECGVLFRWRLPDDIAGTGTGAAKANDIVSMAEAALKGYALPAASSADGYTHKVLGFFPMQSLGHFDDKRQRGELSMIIVVTVMTY